MTILVACEESQEVCKAFRKLGHQAFSCDIQDCSGGHPEWHIKGDVLKIINGNCFFVTEDVHPYYVEEWDMILAFPPCTHLAVSGAKHFEKKRRNGQQYEGIDFFGKMLNANCKKVVVENPVNIINGNYIKKYFPDLCEKYNLPMEPTQRIQPWNFGDNYSKTTCLWLKGVQPLKVEITEEPAMEYKEFISKKTGKKKRQNLWYYQAFCNHTPEERARIRSKTFPGIARAMAEQWGGKI